MVRVLFCFVLTSAIVLNKLVFNPKYCSGSSLGLGDDASVGCMDFEWLCIIAMADFGVFRDPFDFCGLRLNSDYKNRILISGFFFILLSRWWLILFDLILEQRICVYLFFTIS